MAYSTERSEEILRIVAVSIVGAILMVVQRSLFSIGTIVLNVSNPEGWARETFTPAAVIIFLVSVIFAGLWYLTALRSNNDYVPEKHHKPILLRWVGFFLTTLIITGGVALYFDGEGEGQSSALPWFAGFLLFDMALIYWVSTAISTPGLLAGVVPGSHFFRRLLRINK